MRLRSMSRRFVPVLTAAVFTFSLAACGDQGSGSATSATTVPHSTSTTAPGTSSTASPTSASTPVRTATAPVVRQTVTKTVAAAAPSTATVSATQQCGSSSETDAVNAHIGSVSGGRAWMIDPASGGNTYQPCAALSFVPLSFMGATGSSPEPIMLFHDGTYLGTTTAQGYPIGDVQQNGDNSIRVEYIDGDHNPHWTTFTYTGGQPPVSMTGTDPSTLYGNN